MGIFSRKDRIQTSFVDAPLEGKIGKYDFRFRCGFAVRDNLFPEDNWSVVLYDQNVNKEDINIEVNHDKSHYPHIYLKIKKDPDIKLYDINTMGTYGPGRKGAVVTARIDSRKEITFNKGELELLNFDFQQGVISARIVAFTKDKKNYINGTFEIRIDGGLVTGRDKTFNSQPLQGQLNGYRFSFVRGYALPNFLRPEDSWNVLLYDRDVLLGDIITSGRFDQNNFPNIAFNLENNSVICNYIINTMGTGSSGKKGIIASICTDRDEDISFDTGRLEVLDINSDERYIKARMWAVTHNGKYKLQGIFTVEIVEPEQAIADTNNEETGESLLLLLMEAKRIHEIISGPQKKILARVIEKYETSLLQVEEQKGELQTLLEEIIKEGPLQH